MKALWYQFIKIYIQTGLFFYTKKITLIGKEHVPKKGAVLFTVNHPNGLLDPLLVTTNTPRVTHYLVRAAIFKKPLVKKFLATLNLMPIYRIRDGIKELSKNTSVFNDCFEIFKKQEALMIFPEGSHDRRRTVRAISKGFTRIIFGAIDTYPDLNISIVPIGVTYQNSSQFPCKVTIQYGKPIIANDFYNPNKLNNSITELKSQIATQLQELSVHIPANDTYNSILETLNKNNTDFTDVSTVNKAIKEGVFKENRAKINYVRPIYYIIALNSFIPWVIWKLFAKKVDEIEFIDTFRFALGISLFPIFYYIQTLIINSYFGLKVAGVYFVTSLLLVLIYSKFSTTPTE